MSYTAINNIPSYVGNIIFQAGHGFIVGDVLRFDGVNYVKSFAITLAAASVDGMCAFVMDVNHFYLVQVGTVLNLATAPNNPAGAYVPGAVYYLSDIVPGALTENPGTNRGEGITTCFKAITTTSGYFMANAPQEVDNDIDDWTTVVNNTLMNVKQGYIVNGVGSISFTLPTAFSEGDQIMILGAIGNGWSIIQNAGQSIILNGTTTTPGVAGSLTSNNNWNSVYMIAVNATQWQILSVAGTLTVV